MPRTTPVSRRAALSALSSAIVSFAAASLAACSTPDIPGAPSITPPTPLPGVPGTVAGGTAGATVVASAPALPGTPAVAVVTVAPAEIVAPPPTLLPTSPAVNATGTALRSTSVALSATATTEVRATLGTFEATSTALTAGGGIPVIGSATVGSATVGTPGGLASIPVVNTPAVTATPLPANAPTPTIVAAIPTVVPTVAPVPVVSTVAPAVQMAVNAARTRFERVNALHFTLAVDGFVYLDDARSQRLTAADGDLVRPDRVALTARVAVSSIVAQVRFIQIAEAAFITNILTGRWQTAPSGFSYDPRIVFDPTRGVSAVVGGVQSWTLVENVRVSNTDTQHLRGTAPAALAAPLVSNSLRGEFVDVDMYVEGRNSDVLKLILAEQPAAIPDGSPVSKWTLDLSRQNENITIAAPMVGATATR